jgi:predicted O-methyltransferase YrrM
MGKADAVRKAGEIDGWMSEAELGWLYDQAADRDVVIEIGVWKGRSTTALCEACPGVVIAVDHFSGGDPEEAASPAVARDQNVRAQAIQNLMPYLDSGKLVLVQTPSDKAFETLRKLFPGRFADMVFIDGDHRVEAVRLDLRYRDLIKDGGLLSGYDYDWAGVREAVEHLKPLVAERLWWTHIGG